MAQPSMKKLLAVALFVFAAVLNSFPASTNQPPTSAEQLRSELEAALEAKDTNAVLLLFNWDGVSNKTNGFGYANMVAKGLSDFFLQHPTNSIRPRVYFQPLPENFETEEMINGFRYAANVSVKGMIQFGVSAANNVGGRSWIIPYGETNGCFYLAGTTIQKIYEPKVPEKIFFLAVSPSLWPEPMAFACTYTYVQNNREIEKTINGTNSVRKTFWGDYVKSCTVQKTDGGKSSLKLEIKAGVIRDQKIVQTTLFSGETTSTNDSISYERKN